MAPRRLSTSPWVTLLALAMTLGTFMFSTVMVASTLTSTFSAMQMMTVSQFCTPVSSRDSISRESTTMARSVNFRASRTRDSSRSMAMTSRSAEERLSTRARPKRPRPMTPKLADSSFRFITRYLSFLRSKMAYPMVRDSSV